ncbi:MAG: DUF4199 domain-containing protein [Bacteroidetes bacterium]|nr:MAG: DUF4199 domain-containing protein [Bacteroidota bacterium]TAG93131.1 MAG: DUF4199 domain-containing protein [Bacteroidota bacterium]
MQKVIKTGFFFGILGGFFFIIFIFIAYFVSQQPFEANVKSLDFFIYLITLSVAIYWFRFKINENTMKFWTAMGVGMITILVMVMINSFFVYVFLGNIVPNELIKYKQKQLVIIEKIKNNLELDSVAQKKLDKKEFEKNKNEKKEFEQIYQGMKKVTAYDMAWYEWRTKILLGIFMTFIISAVLRK